jgi:predicted transposase YbfD/YdcC
MWKPFSCIARGHWGIENRLHWVLDVVFRDDLTRLSSANGPANTAVVEHTALNLLNRAKPITSLKNRRKRQDGTRIAWRVIRQTA